MLKKYVDMGKLDPVRKGLYTLTDEFTDEFALLQAQSAKIIFLWHRTVLLGDVGQDAEHLGYNAASRNEHQQVKA